MGWEEKLMLWKSGEEKVDQEVQKKGELKKLNE